MNQTPGIDGEWVGEFFLRYWEAQPDVYGRRWRDEKQRVAIVRLAREGEDGHWFAVGDDQTVHMETRRTWGPRATDPITSCILYAKEHGYFER